MYSKFSEEIKDRGYKDILQEHNNSVEAVLSYAKAKGYYSENSKIAYLKNELKRVKNQKVSNSDYYKENMYLLQEIRKKINQV
mgnify:CR=1 FL=1